MTTGSKKSGDMVLGGRHLVGIFAVLVVLFAAVFTLGYFMGRGEIASPFGGSASSTAASHAAPSVPVAVDKPEVKPDATTAEKGAPTPPADLDFYHSAEPAQPSDRLVAQPKPVATPKVAVVSPDASPAGAVARRKVAKSASSPGSLGEPLIPKGATVLQVAALTQQNDALALAQALQQKKFPAFVLNPSSDHYYRVQVGPFADNATANATRQKLEGQGFKSIVKR